MKIEEAIDIIDKELHKKWDKKVEKKDGMTYIHLGDEEPLNEFEKASQRCLVEVQSLNREIERLNNIINGLEKWLKEEVERLMTIEQSNNVIFLIGAYTEVLDKLQELKGSDKE